MELTSALLATILLIAISLFLFPLAVKRWRLIRMTSKLPGFNGIPILGNFIPFLFKKQHEMFRVFLSYFDRRSRPVFCYWLGPKPMVCITLPEHVEVALKNSRILDKSFLYKFLHPWVGTGLLTSTGSKWHSRRKMLTPTFHFNILKNFVDIFSEKSEVLVKKLQKEVGKDSFNLYPYITRCALDIICETAMGTAVDALQDESSQYVTSVYGAARAIRHRMITQYLFVDFIFWLSSSGRQLSRCLEVLHGFTNKIIQERKLQRQLSEHTQTNVSTGKKNQVAFLDMLLEASEGGAKLTDEEIREEVDTFMFEGHDTTTSALCFALHLLGLHPDVQSKAYEEQKNIFQGSDRSATWEDLNEMRYLERVIKEALRLYPSVPEIAREVFNDVEIGEYTVPAGSTLHVHIYYMHRNPEQFPDPEKFDPDNFLPERVAKRHPYAYIPFSAGPRNCIGQKFALLEEKTVLSYMLRHYEVRSHGNSADLKIENGIILRSTEGFEVSITARNGLLNGAMMLPG